MIDVLVPWTGGLSAQKKKGKKKMSFAIDVYDRRARTRNEYRGFLFIIHL